MATVTAALRVRVIDDHTTRLRRWLGIRLIALGSLIMGLGKVEVVGRDDRRSDRFLSALADGCRPKPNDD